MGYSYDMRGRLACDACGHVGGVRKRTCPHRVHYTEGGSLPYCYPSALCKACYATHKATLHAGCKERAAKSTAAEVARKAKLDAGELERRTAWGDWHADVPSGFVGVRFVGPDREVFKLLPAATYDSGHWLSDYPDAREWTGPVSGARSKEASLVMNNGVPSLVIR